MTSRGPRSSVPPEEATEPAPEPEPVPEPVPLARRRRERIRAALSSRQALRDVILIGELLGPPVATRGRGALER